MGECEVDSCRLGAAPFVRLGANGTMRASTRTPSVSVPESVIPSAGAASGDVRLFPDVLLLLAVLLPESFRGGCSFGADTGPVVRVDLSRKRRRD